MNPKDESILTEDGRRLSLEDGEITGTENTGPGLAYDTGNKLDQPPTMNLPKEQTDQPGE